MFWKEVDRIGAALHRLLLPLYYLLQEEGLKQGRGMPPLGELYQRLHDIVAAAGYVAVQVRTSPAITVYEWLKPGQQFVDGHRSAVPDTFEYSRRAAEEYDDELDLPSGLWDRTSRCKIAVRPKITRYSPLEDGEGLSTFRVMDGLCVFYKGWADATKDKEFSHTLREHVRAAKWDKVHRGARFVWTRLFLTLVLFGFFLVILFEDVRAIATWREGLVVRRGVKRAAEAAAQSAADFKLLLSRYQIAQEGLDIRDTCGLDEC